MSHAQTPTQFELDHVSSFAFDAKYIKEINITLIHPRHNHAKKMICTRSRDVVTFVKNTINANIWMQLC